MHKCRAGEQESKSARDPLFRSFSPSFALPVRVHTRASRWSSCSADSRASDDCLFQPSFALHASALCSLAENLANELLIVDVPVSVKTGKSATHQPTHSYHSVPPWEREHHSRPNLHTLEQLIHLLITQLLSKARKDISELARANVPISFFVEHLEAPDEFLGCSGGLEAIGSVQDVEEGVEVD